MVNLSEPADKLLRTQVGEAVAAVARCDFPDAWPDLIPRLVSSLSPSDYNINTSVLTTAHNIFAPWKSQTRSDTLYSTINTAVAQFSDAYFAIFRATAAHVLTAGIMDAAVLGLLGDTMDLLFLIYHDLTTQDLPPVFEDAQEEFFGNDSEQGWFLKFLLWDPPLLRGDVRCLEPRQMRNRTILTIRIIYLAA